MMLAGISEDTVMYLFTDVRSRSESSRSGTPRTYVGQWLRAILLRQYDLRDRLILKLNGGQEVGWNDDEPAVVEAACELSVRRYFGAPYDASAVTEFVRELREVTDDDVAFPQLKTEPVIRAALGEMDTAAGDIKRGEKYRIQLAAISLAQGSLGRDETVINELILDAERVAGERGWNPPLADAD